LKEGKVQHLFPGGNTAQGFFGFYQQGLKDMQKVFILKGGPGTGKSTLIRKIARDMVARGYNVDMWQCSSDNDSVDGVVIKSLSIAVVDGTFPHVVEPRYPGAVEQIINLGDCWDQGLLQDNKLEIKNLSEKISSCFTAAYEKLKIAEKARNEKEKEESPKEEEIQQKADQIVNEIFSCGLPKVRHFYASAITPEGWVGYAQDISAACNIRYILAGGTSLAKSTVITSVAKAAKERGHDADIYHQALTPELLEMLVLPGLGIAVLDKTAPGIIPLSGDKEHLFSSCLTNIEPSQWQGLIDEAISFLFLAHQLHDELETYYTRAIDFEAVDNLRKNIFEEILTFAAVKEKE